MLGAVSGAAFGWDSAAALSQSAQLGIALAGFERLVNFIGVLVSSPGVYLCVVLGGGVGFVYGLFIPRKRSPVKLSREKTKFNLKSCAWCKGFGVEGKSRQPCKACDGHGSILVEQTAQKCSKCKGKGRALRRKCKNCGGVGWAAYALLDEVDTPTGRQGIVV